MPQLTFVIAYRQTFTVLTSLHARNHRITNPVCPHHLIPTLLTTDARAAAPSLQVRAYIATTAPAPRYVRGVEAGAILREPRVLHAQIRVTQCLCILQFHELLHTRTQGPYNAAIVLANAEQMAPLAVHLHVVHFLLAMCLPQHLYLYKNWQ